jgi:hypothetical protein
MQIADRGSRGNGKHAFDRPGKAILSQRFGQTFCHESEHHVDRGGSHRVDHRTIRFRTHAGAQLAGQNVEAAQTK